MTCSSAINYNQELNGSPQGAFVLIGQIPAGTGLLVVMLLGKHTLFLSAYMFASSSRFDPHILCSHNNHSSSNPSFPPSYSTTQWLLMFFLFIVSFNLFIYLFVCAYSVYVYSRIFILLCAALICYVAWRWWEAFTFQGADATFGPFKNFFGYRLSPFVSGCVYVAYTYYLLETLAHSEKVNIFSPPLLLSPHLYIPPPQKNLLTLPKPTCYPECWRHSVIGKIGLVLFGIAFSIACLTQLLNAFTRKWHAEIDWAKCHKIEKWVLLVLGHLGFLGRSGLFLFVAILMFRALHSDVHQNGNTLANGINQFIGDSTGRVFMFIVGFFTVVYGAFALLCTRYRFFPTPPPSGQPLFYKRNPSPDVHTIVKGEGDGAVDTVVAVEKKATPDQQV